jgi:hypothetical protein
MLDTSLIRGTADGRGTTLSKPYQLYSLKGCHSDPLMGEPSKALPPSSSSSEALFIPTALRPPAGQAVPHPMRSRFIETTPKWMRCSDEKGPTSIERKSVALDRRYLQPNSSSRIGWQIFDLDFAGAADAFDEMNVAVPNFVAENPKNGHAQYGYALEVPVANSARARREPMAYLQAIRNGMTRRLGADQNFKFGIGKNPLHSDWRTTWLNVRPHSLNDMAVWLEFEEMRPAHRSQVDENEFAQQGRNCSITSDLAKFGLRTAWQFKQGGPGYEQFLREMRAQAFELNNGFAPPLGFAEVQGIAKSVAKWSWSRSTAERFSEIQSYRAQARRRRNLAIIGQLTNAAEISVSDLADTLGRSERTAYRYLSEIREKTTSDRQAQPWQMLGVSRRTYYRRKVQGALSTKASEQFPAKGRRSPRTEHAGEI